MFPSGEVAYCPYCGHKTSTDVQFCENCGSKLG
ncbi:MAG: zinc ribbon domain-containing protein [Candidatus Heimdallarchaeaceae archaeon]